MDNHTFENPLHPLLLQTLRLEGPCQNPAAFQSLTEAEWIALTGEAIRLRLAYAFDQFLHRHPDLMHRAPEICRERLKKTQRQTLLLNLKRQAQLRKLLDALDKEGIPCLLMKGLWIVEVLYGNHAARNSGDIDLLFKPEDMPRFTRLVQRMGYGIDSTLTDIREIAAGNNEFALADPGNDVRFDIHWSLTHPVFEQAVNESAIWDRAQTYSIAGRPCLSLDVEDHLLLLCFHAANHHHLQYVGLRALLDIGQAIIQPPRPMDWAVFQQRAVVMHWDRGVALMFDLMCETLGLPIPAEIQIPEPSKDHIQLRSLALLTLVEDQNYHDCLPPQVIKLFNRRGINNRLEHLLHRLFLPADQIKSYFGLPSAQPVNQMTLTALHARRWFKILRDNSLRLIGLWQGDPKRRKEWARSSRLQAWLETERSEIP